MQNDGSGTGGCLERIHRRCECGIHRCEQNSDAAESYGIRLIPTQIFFDSGGNELFRHEGYMSREDMTEKLIEFGYTIATSQD